MKKLISSFFIAAILALSSVTSTYAKNFDKTFFNLNSINYYDALDEQCISGTDGSTNLIGNDNVEKVWNFFKSKGLSDNQVAGIIGGKWGETGGSLDPKAIESGQPFDEARAMSNQSNYAFGIAQWDGGRRPALLNYAKEKGKSWDTLELQLDFMWHELQTSEKATYDAIIKSDSIRDVAYHWVHGYERPREDLRAGRVEEGEKVGKDLVARFGGKGDSGRNSSSGQSSIPNKSSFTFIGDSLTVGVKDQLESTFPGSDIRAESGQGVSWAINQLTDSKDTVVINIGTNDKFINGSSLLEKLKDKKKVYLIDIYGTGGNADYTTTNNNIIDSAKNYPNVEILSWKNYIDANGGRDKYYVVEPDGSNYHMSEDGKALYIKFLKEKLSGSNSGAGSDSCSGGKFSTSGDASSTTKDGFPIFLQDDPRWANEIYAPQFNFTMREAACGPTSFTMILTAFGITANPLDVAKKANELGEVVKGGALGTQATVLAKEYNLKAEQIEYSVDEINKRLDQGQLIWAGGSGMEPPFTSGGHMVVIRKKTSSGKWLIANPYSYAGHNISQELLDPMYEWNPSDVVRNMNMATAVWK